MTCVVQLWGATLSNYFTDWASISFIGLYDDCSWPTLVDTDVPNTGWNGLSDGYICSWIFVHGTYARVRLPWALVLECVICVCRSNHDTGLGARSG